MDDKKIDINLFKKFCEGSIQFTELYKDGLFHFPPTFMFFGKHKIHKKKCSTCSEEDIKIPKFNQESGELNGSNGFRGEKNLQR